MKTTTTSTSLTMKTVSKSTLNVTNSTAEKMTCSSSQFIVISFKPYLTAFTSYPSVKLRFVQTGANNYNFNLYKCDSNYFVSSLSYPTYTYEENGLYVREVDITKEYINHPDETIYFALCANAGFSLTIYTDNTTNENYKPQLVIEEVINSRPVKYQTELNGSSFDKDMYKVNPRTGELKYSINLMNIESNHLPLNLMLNYDERNITNSTVATGISTNFPIGWRLNYQQFIYPSGNNYIYVDGSNVKHTFVLANNLTSESSNKVYFDQDGTYLTLTIDSNSNYVIKTGNEIQELIFNSSGYLTQIVQKTSETSSHTVSLSYDTNNKLTTIQKSNGDRITISYDTANSQIIILSKGNKRATLTYNSSNLLESVVSPSGETTSFTYTTNNTTFLTRAVPVVLGLKNRLLSITTNNKRIDFTYFNKIQIIKAIDEVYFDDENDYYDVHYDLTYSKLQTKITMTPNSNSSTNNGTIIKVLTFNDEGELVREHELDDGIEKNSTTFHRENGLSYEYSDSATSIIHYDDREKLIDQSYSSQVNNIYVYLHQYHQEIMLEEARILKLKSEAGIEDNEENEEEIDKPKYLIFLNYQTIFNSGCNPNINNTAKVKVYEPKAFYNEETEEVEYNSILLGEFNFDTSKDFEQQLIIPVKTNKVQLQLEFINENPLKSILIKSRKVIKVADSKQKILADFLGGTTELNFSMIDEYLLPKLSLSFLHDGSEHTELNTTFTLNDLLLNRDNYFRSKNETKSTYNIWSNEGKALYANVDTVFYLLNDESYIHIQLAKIFVATETNDYITYQDIDYVMNSNNKYQKKNSNHIYSIEHKNQKTTSIKTFDFYGNELIDTDDNKYTKEFTYNNGNIVKEKITNCNEIYTTIEPEDTEINLDYSYINDRVYEQSQFLNNEKLGKLYFYNSDGEQIKESSAGNTPITLKEFEYNEDKLQSIKFYPDSVNKANSFEYSLNNLLSKIKRESTLPSNYSLDNCFEFIYDTKNNLSEVKIFGNSYCIINNDFNDGLQIKTYTYQTGKQTKESYDKYGRVTKIESRDNENEDFTLISEYTYQSVLYLYNDSEEEIWPIFNSPDSPLLNIAKNDHFVSNSFDPQGKMTIKSYDDIGLTGEFIGHNINYETTGFEEPEEHNIFQASIRKLIDDGAIEHNISITEFEAQGNSFATQAPTIYSESIIEINDNNFTFSENCVLEKLRRAYKKSINETIDKENNERLLYETIYDYAQANSTLASPFICSENYKIYITMDDNPNNVNKTIQYTYDNKGNIASIITDDKTTTYEYDIHGQLIRENNEELGKTFLIEYDEYGNIINKKEYNYNDTSTLLKEDIYTYSSSNKTLLTKFNNQNIIYNSDLFPNYYKGKSLSWEHRNLSQYGDIKFKYALDGGRLEKGKVVNDGFENIHYYSIDGSDIIKEINYDTGLNLIFIQGCQYKIGFIYDGVAYHYRRNILGDIIEIYRQNTLVAKYVYDAWGNHKVLNPDGTENTNSTFIGNINPLRYRGYYYDVETQLFYCNSRYYSPELCRWISPDSIEYLDPESINGLNLYCYCFNNPVNYVDPDGHMALWAIALIGIAVCGLINGTMNVMTKMPEESAWGAFAGGFFEGAVSAAALAAGLAIGTFTGGAGWVILGGTVAVTGGFIGGKYGNAISQQISYGNVDWGVANLNGVFAALTNLVSYAGLYVNKDILSTSGKLGIRFLENVGPSAVGLGMTAYIASLPKPNLNEFRDEERIKSQRGRFIWDYWF